MEDIGTYTGMVIAVDRLATAHDFWTMEMGCQLSEHDADGSRTSSLIHPQTGQLFTLVEIAEPNPAMSMAIRTKDAANSQARLETLDYKVLWSDNSRPDGTVFVMCQNSHGVSLLLYQLA